MTQPRSELGIAKPNREAFKFHYYSKLLIWNLRMYKLP